MRAREFITESRYFLIEGPMDNAEWVKPKYVENLLDGLVNQQPYTFEFPAKGDNITGIIQNPELVKQQVENAVKGWDAARFASAKIKVSIAVVDDETGELTGEIIDNIPINRMYKDEKIKGELVPNMGNVSEALLGCAVAAKFANNGKLITERQLVDMGRQLARNKGYIETSAGKDKLIFKVTIPHLDKKAFYAWLGESKKSLQDYNVPESSIALIERRAKIAVEYANTSKRVLGAVKAAQDDPRNNKVDVISDGGEKENQNITKVDLKILIDGKEKAKRLLSVKAGDVAQFGQVVGANLSHVSEFFGSFGVQLSPAIKKYFYEIVKGAKGAETKSQKIYNFDNGMKAAYEDAFKQFKKKAGTNPTGLVEDVFQGLLQHLTRKESGVEMVILDPDDKKAFRELDFGENFEKALRQLQIVVTTNMKGKAHVISIYGYPIGSIAKKFVPAGRKDASNKLLDLRSQYKDGTVRNMTSMGGLLKDIADIENYIEKQEEPQAQQQKQQVTKPAVKKSATVVNKLNNPQIEPETPPTIPVGQPMGMKTKTPQSNSL